MFAFALWDAPRRRLLLVRDRLGIKPLYWATADSTLLFASEIKGVLASRRITAQPNTSVLPEVLSTRYVSGPQTMFRDVHKLLPGHRLIFERGSARVEQYWDIPSRTAPGSIAPGQVAHVVERFRELLEESVRLRLMSDVPVGMFLSGGLDSSAIAVLMTKHLDRPLRTFSVAFRDRTCNELGYARAVAHLVRADPHEVVIDDDDFFATLPRLLWHEDEPVAHPSSVPLYFVSKLAQRRVTVVLTGEGSDELLAGYGKYPRIAWNWRAGTVYERMLPKPLRQAVAAQIVPRVPGRIGELARRSFLAMARTSEAMCFDNFAAIRLAEQRRLLTARANGGADTARPYAASAEYFSRLNGSATLLDRLLYTDLKTYLVELLMKQDQMSMAASIESRVPFLDHVLVEFAATLPDDMKLSGWTTKRILREAMRGSVPDSILNRPKMGFPVPLSQWTRGRWNRVVADVLLDRRTQERGLIDRQSVERLLAQHASGLTDGGDRLWALLNLELWYRTFIDGGGVQTLPVPQRSKEDPGSISAPTLTRAPVGERRR
jgi:asparagine synthase (glutamine-hydrolysing)